MYMYVYTYTVIQYLYCLLRTYLLVRELVRDDTGPWSADEDDEWVNVCVLLNSLFIWCVEYTYIQYVVAVCVFVTICGRWCVRVVLIAVRVS